jgi:hypothetical protein
MRQSFLPSSRKTPSWCLFWLAILPVQPGCAQTWTELSSVIFCAESASWCQPRNAPPGRPFGARQGGSNDIFLLGPPTLPFLSPRLEGGYPVAAASQQIGREVPPANLSVRARSGKLRAGIIEDSDADPDFPTVISGIAVWTPVNAAENGQAGSIVVDVDIASGQSGLRLVFKLAEQSGQLVIEGELKGSLAKADNQVLEMPRARRTGATEGEPLAGRVTMTDPGKFIIELTPEGRDLANNWRRMTQAPWLDFRIGAERGRPSIVTIEKGRFGNELVAEVFKSLAPR